MTKAEKIANDSYMVLQGIAFLFSNTSEKSMLVAINLKDTDQKAFFRLRNDGKFLFSDSNMSKENTYKSMLIVERNNNILLEGLKIWENTLKTE